MPTGDPSLLTVPRFASPTRGQTARLLRQAGMGVLGLATVALFSDDEGTILCPFRRCTGGYCPLCGGTRSAGMLLRGDIAGSVGRHPLVLLLALQIPIFLTVWLTPKLERLQKQIWAERLIIANMALAIAIWIPRMILGDVPGPTGFDSPF